MNIAERINNLSKVSEISYDDLKMLIFGVHADTNEEVSVEDKLKILENRFGIESIKKWRQIPKYGDVFTFDEWIEMITDGSIIDYDGSGSWCNKELNVIIPVDPYKYDIFQISKKSDGSYKGVPPLATHIIWFNK